MKGRGIAEGRDVAVAASHANSSFTNEDAGVQTNPIAAAQSERDGEHGEGGGRVQSGERACNGYFKRGFIFITSCEKEP